MILKGHRHAVRITLDGHQRIKVRFYRRLRRCRAAFGIGNADLTRREAFREAFLGLFRASGELFREQVGIHFR